MVLYGHHILRLPYFREWFPPLNSFHTFIYVLYSKKNGFRGNYSRKYGIWLLMAITAPLASPCSAYTTMLYVVCHKELKQSKLSMFFFIGEDIWTFSWLNLTKIHQWTNNGQNISLCSLAQEQSRVTSEKGHIHQCTTHSVVYASSSPQGKEKPVNDSSHPG